MNKKFEITSATKTVYNDGREYTLHRIKALRDITLHGVYAGTYGGWVESEKNLSQEGDCWIENDAQVYQCATVAEDAYVCNSAKVMGSARIYGRANVCDRAVVDDEARIYGHASINGDAVVEGAARVYDHAQLFDCARVFDEAVVSDGAVVFGEVFGDAIVDGNVRVGEDARLGRGAGVMGAKDFMVVLNSGVDDKPLTIYRTPANEVRFARGGVVHTGEEFVHHAYFCDEMEHTFTASRAKALVKMAEVVMAR